MRSRKTPALITGAAIEPSKWRLDTFSWVVAGEEYCRPFHAAMLALHVHDRLLAVQSSHSLASRAAAQKAARQSQAAFRKVAGKDADLQREAAKGRVLQCRITRVTNRFILAAAFEDAAPPSRQASDWLENVEKAANAFVSAVSHPIDGPAKSMARGDLERHLRAIMKGVERRTARKDWAQAVEEHEMRLTDVAALVQDIQFAARLAGKDVASEPTIRTGDAWDRWAIDVWNACSAFGLPVGVSNRLTASGELSPFVRLLASLQDRLPESLGFRHGSGADLALAAAINEARARARKS